ncbi:MAG TPA: ABC transporter permease [Bryobacteraceae bacterium]|nr:ABC transporter permease [Bryobacteraceae bacterium]
MLDLLRQDIRFGLRTLARSPLFTGVAAVSLALGIGVNIAIFGFVNAALWKPLAVEQPSQLVSLYHTKDRGPEEFSSSSYPEFEFYRDHNTVFSGMLAYLRVPVVIGTGAEAEQVSGELVSPGYFSVLGIRPPAGRFLADDEQDAVAVISDAYWRTHFDRDPSAIGRTVTIGVSKFTVIGVAPATFRGIVMDWSDSPSVWLPVEQYRQAVPAFNLDIIHNWGGESYLVSARLRPGVTVEQADAQVAALTARIRETQNRRLGQHAILFPVQQARFWPTYRGAIETFLTAMMMIVGAILLIACCNLANLLLARAANRRREIAIRLALGAGRLRIARQVMVESLLLAAMGGLAATLVSGWVTSFLAQFHRVFRIPLAIDTSWDMRMLLFAVGISVVTGLLFGAAPVLETWRTDLNQSMRTGAAASGNPRSRLRSGLLVGQVALSTVLLTGAGLFVGTLRNARAEDPTVRAETVLLANLQPALSGYSEAQGQQFYAEVLRRVRAIPGVQSASMAALVAFGGMRGGTDILDPDQRRVQVDFNTIAADYFETTGLPLLRGREFTERDRAGTASVAIVNEMLAARFWPGANPLGKELRLLNPERTASVVGVVRDGKFRGYRDTLRPGFYLPVAQQYRGAMTLEVRTSGNSAQFAVALRRTIQSVDASLPITEIVSMKTRLDEALSQERLIAGFASGLGLLALTLAAIGIYGVLSFVVGGRTREIGIRMVMGARPLGVWRMILQDVAILAGCGFAIGASAAVFLARMAGSLLYGVSATNPAAYGAAFGLLTAVALASAWIPAWRAARLDPAATLRSE